jgi:hypothetical protein
MLRTSRGRRPDQTNEIDEIDQTDETDQPTIFLTSWQSSTSFSIILKQEENTKGFD